MSEVIILKIRKNDIGKIVHYSIKLHLNFSIRKKLISALASFFAFAAFFSIAYSPVYSQEIKNQPRTVRVGLFPAAPLVFSKDNQPDGLFIDLIEYFSAELDWNIEYVPGKWGDLLVMLKEGNIDLLPAVGYTSERDKIYDFSEIPVFIDSGVVFTGKNFILHTVSDLKGKKVAALRGSIFTNAFIEYMNSFGVDCDIIYTDNNEDVMRAIADKTADAGVCIYSLGNELAAGYDVRVTPVSFSPIALHYAVPEGINQDLLQGINRLMSVMQDDPKSVYNLSFQKWTGEKSRERIPVWIWWSISVLLFAGLFFALWSYILNVRVALKTRHLTTEIEEHKLAEHKLEKALRERDSLIRELYHRTGNTLHVIQGLIGLQARQFHENDDIKILVQKTDERIQAISLVHRMLFKSGNLSFVPIPEYVDALCKMFFRSSDNSPQVSFDLDIEEQNVVLDVAIPFGLILNELLTNSVKHAFRERSYGKISIRVRHVSDGKSVLEYSDDGTGNAGEIDFESTSGLGIQLMKSICENQLSGSIVFDYTGGFRCRMTFSNNLYFSRVNE